MLSKILLMLEDHVLPLGVKNSITQITVAYCITVGKSAIKVGTLILDTKVCIFGISSVFFQVRVTKM